jgi:large subunit ribosomal protein L25
MEQETLRAARRESSGSRPAQRLRRAGNVPAVVYGRGLDTVAVTVSGRELYAILHKEAGLNAIISLAVDDGDQVLTVAREIQRDPVRGSITHLDFIKVSLDEEINAEVTIDFVGTPVGVKDGGGFVETMSTTVTISALPMQIPNSIEVDISGLGVFDTVKVADLPAIEGVSYLTDPDHPLASVLLPSVAEEVAEAEEGEPEEGAAAAEGADAGEGSAAGGEEGEG